jgi:hypothetical protein
MAPVNHKPVSETGNGIILQMTAARPASKVCLLR